MEVGEYLQTKTQTLTKKDFTPKSIMMIKQKKNRNQKERERYVKSFFILGWEVFWDFWFPLFFANKRTIIFCCAEIFYSPKEPNQICVNLYKSNSFAKCLVIFFIAMILWDSFPSFPSSPLMHAYRCQTDEIFPWELSFSALLERFEVIFKSQFDMRLNWMWVLKISHARDCHGNGNLFKQIDENRRRCVR